MKKQSSRARAQSTPIVRHQLEHPVPTVIHDPEEKMTALGRLAHHAMLEPRRYLGWPLAIIGGLIVAALAWRMANGVTSNESEVWTKLEAARTPSERVNLAKANPKSPAATWAKLQAATGYFNEALADLPNNSEVALSALKKSLDLFDQVIREAPHDSAPARVAALGRARTLEMKNDLPKAIEQYERVAKEWPDSPEADEARHFAEALKDPQAVAFYKDLYAYSPTTVTIPGGGTETFPSTGLGSGLPGGLLNPGPAAKTPAGKSASDLRDLMVPGRNEVVEPRAGTPAPGAAPKSNPPAPKIEAPKPAAMPSPGGPGRKTRGPQAGRRPELRYTGRQARGPQARLAEVGSAGRQARGPQAGHRAESLHSTGIQARGPQARRDAQAQSTSRQARGHQAGRRAEGIRSTGHQAREPQTSCDAQAQSTGRQAGR